MISPVQTGNKNLDLLLRQLVEIANKQNKNGGVVTVNDLVSAGVVSLVGGGVTSADKMPRPVRPEGLNGIGTYETAILTWKASDHPSKTITAVYRSTTNDFSTSALVSVVLGNQFSDISVAENVTYFYWVKFVRNNGVEGPISGTSGVEVYVPVSSATLISKLSGKISQTELATSLSTDINNLKVESNQRTLDVNAMIGAELDAALALSKAGDNERDILSLSAGGDANMTTIQSWVDQEAQVRASDDDALAILISNLTTVTNGNSANINSIQTAYADADDALAILISNLESTVGNNDAAIQQSLIAKANKTDAPYAMWEVKATVNGLTAGLGLFNNGESTSVGVNANMFYVFDATTESKITPFIIESGSTYINSAVIKDASIDKAKIGSVYFSSIKDGDGAAVTVGGKLKADFIDVTNLSVASAAIFSGNVNSSSYSAGTTGWALLQNGDAVFENITCNGGTFKGSLNCAGGKFKVAQSGNISTTLPNGTNSAVCYAETSSSSVAGVVGYSSKSYGVLGESSSGDGVRGISETNDGVQGSTESSTRGGGRFLNPNGPQVVLGGAIGNTSDMINFTERVTFPAVVNGGLLSTPYGLFYGVKVSSGYRWMDMVRHSYSIAPYNQLNGNMYKEGDSIPGQVSSAY